LSAAKYSLQNMARDAAEERADAREGYFFYDQSTKSTKSPYGQMVFLSKGKLAELGGNIPANLVEKDLISKSIVAANDATKRLNALLVDNAKTYRITQSEEKDLRGRLNGAREAFVSGETGINLLGAVKASVAKDEIGGFANAGKELLRQAFSAAGMSDKLDKKFSTISQAKADVRQAFQALIPVSLGSTQSANSISNRDVQFLADAYINSGFLNNGAFNFATLNMDALGSQLDGAIAKFQDRQRFGLAELEAVQNRLSESEAELTQARKMGVLVSPGPFARSLDPVIKELSPYAEVSRLRLQGKFAPPLFKLELDPTDGIYRVAK